MSWMVLRSWTPSFMGRWKALRPEMRPVPPARLLITAVATASSKSVAPDAPPPVVNARAAHVAVGHLVARQVDGMVAGEIGVDALVEFAVAGIAHVEGLVAAIIFR